MRNEPYQLSADTSVQLQQAVHPKCPACGARHILAAPVTITESGAQQVLTCRSCLHGWTVDYATRPTNNKQT